MPKLEIKINVIDNKINDKNDELMEKKQHI